MELKKLRKISEYLFYLFFGSLIFSNTLAQGIAIILIFLWILKWLLTRKFIRSPLDFPVIIYLLVRTITCFTSVEMMVSLRELRSGIFFSLIYFSITNLNDSEKKDTLINHYIAILIYAGAIASVYGISYVFLHDLTVRAQSTAGGISRFSEYTMIAFCLSFSLTKNRDIFKKRFIAFIVVWITAMGLIFAQARAQWLGIIPMLFIIGIKKEKFLVFYIVTVFGVIFALLRTIRKRVLTLLHPFSNTAKRFTIWKGAKLLILKRPILGFGPRTYPIVSPFLKEKGSWHSDYLQVYMDSGIFGFLSYMYLSFMIFKHSLNITRDPLRKDVGYALFFTMVAMYIVSFFGGHTQEPVITPLFFSLIGFISVLNSMKRQAKVKS